MEDNFCHIWELFLSHGVVPSEKQLAQSVWNSYNLAQKRIIYSNIRNKIRAGKFVNYHPHLAIRDNAPKPPKYKVLSYADYYAQYHTDLEQDGWRRVFQPEKQRTIFVKQI